MATADWVVITVEDLDDYLVGAQLTAINEAALATDQLDRFTKTMQDVAYRIRNKIKSCPQNIVSATPYAIPPELKWAACYLIIEAMQVGLPLPLTENQVTQIAKAVTALDRVADCKDAVTNPTDPESLDVQSGSLATVVISGGTRLTRDLMEGF